MLLGFDGILQLRIELLVNGSPQITDSFRSRIPPALLEHKGCTTFLTSKILFIRYQMLLGKSTPNKLSGGSSSSLLK